MGVGVKVGVGVRVIVGVGGTGVLVRVTVLVAVAVIDGVALGASVKVGAGEAVTVSVGVGDGVAVCVAVGVAVATVGDTTATGGEVALVPQPAMLPAIMTSSKSPAITRLPLLHRCTLPPRIPRIFHDVSIMPSPWFISLSKRY
jgi:hypothetical protein